MRMMFLYLVRCGHTNTRVVRHYVHLEHGVRAVPLILKFFLPSTPYPICLMVALSIFRQFHFTVRFSLYNKLQITECCPYFPLNTMSWLSYKPRGGSGILLPPFVTSATNLRKSESDAMRGKWKGEARDGRGWGMISLN